MTSFNAEAGRELAKIIHEPQTGAADVQRLLDAGADPDIRSQKGIAVLVSIITERDDADIVRVLLDAGADVMATDRKGRIGLELTENPAVLALLLKKNAAAQVAYPNKKYGTQLSRVVIDMNADCLAAMLAAGADPSGAANAEQPPLHVAILMREYEKIDMLLSYHPDTQVNHVYPEDGYTPSMRLLRNPRIFGFDEQVHYVTRMLGMGFDPVHRDDGGLTLLDHISKSPDAVRVPLKKVYDDVLLDRAITRAVAVAIPPRPAMKRKGPA